MKLFHSFLLFLLKRTGYKPNEDVREVIQHKHAEGAMVKDDRDMLGSILDLSQIEVGSVMAHRRDMTTLNIDEDPQVIVEKAIKIQHTRIPFWKDNEENIIGILHTKDILKLRGNPGRNDIMALFKDPMFIPETTTLRDQLEAFRKQRNHLAIVVDEYGSLKGLITLEDILEEIVGQIDDEHDKVIRGIKKQPDDSYIIRGNLNIRDLNREVEWSLPDDDDAHTLAGFVISIAQEIPEVGQVFRYKTYEFTVLGKIRNQITSVRVKELPDPEMSDVQE